MARRTVTAQRGEWVPAKAVRITNSGKVEIYRNSGRRRNVAAGFYEEETGIFHPIRASYDYSRRAAGEKPVKKRKAKGRKRATAKKRAAPKRRRR